MLNKEETQNSCDLWFFLTRIQQSSELDKGNLNFKVCFLRYLLHHIFLATSLGSCLALGFCHSWDVLIICSNIGLVSWFSVSFSSLETVSGIRFSIIMRMLSENISLTFYLAYQVNVLRSTSDSCFLLWVSTISYSICMIFSVHSSPFLTLPSVICSWHFIQTSSALVHIEPNPSRCRGIATPIKWMGIEGMQHLTDLRPKKSSRNTERMPDYFLIILEKSKLDWWIWLSTRNKLLCTMLDQCYCRIWFHLSSRTWLKCNAAPQANSEKRKLRVPISILWTDFRNNR